MGLLCCGYIFSMTEHSAKNAVDSRTNNEQCSLYVLEEGNMIRAVVEEAAALVSIALFIGMIAIWAEVLSSGL